MDRQPPVIAVENPDAEAPEPLPPHIQHTVQTIAKLHADHHQRATPLERIVERMTGVVSHPWFIGALTLTIVSWVGVNLVVARVYGLKLDGDAFPWLQGVGELTAIYITTLVLMSQRRKDEISELREQLTLELAIMTEQKSAKIIALIEELRRDHPELANRVDHQANAMATPADPAAVLDAFIQTHGELMAVGEPELRAPTESDPEPER